MEIFKKINIVPTCRKETIERKEKMENKIKIEQEIVKERLSNSNHLFKNFHQKKQESLNNEAHQTPESQPQQSQNPNQNTEEATPSQTPAETPNENPNQTPNENLDSQQNLIFSQPTQYPKLTNVVENRKDIRNLKALAFGRSGQLSLLLTYIYQFYTLEGSKAVKQTIKEAAKLAMQHYEILNETIVDFGGATTLTDGQGNVWTGRNVNTTKDLKRILLDNIAAEQASIKQYLNAVRESSNLSLAERLLKMIEEKQNLIQKLQTDYENI